MKSSRALRAALQAGSAAEKRLVSEHHCFLLSLVKRFTRQVWPYLVLQESMQQHQSCSCQNSSLDSKAQCILVLC